MLKAFWAGNKPLWQAFWLYKVGGSLLFSVIYISLFPFHQNQVVLLALLLLALIWLGWIFSVPIIVWRNSCNVKTEAWGAIARYVLLLVSFFGIFKIFTKSTAALYPGIAYTIASLASINLVIVIVFWACANRYQEATKISDYKYIPHLIAFSNILAAIGLIIMNAISIK